MPGVYIEEISSGSNPIVGVGTSTAAFIGVVNSTQYPNEPKLITSWNEFVDTYGESNNESSLYSPFEQIKYLPYAVHCFFNEGGTRCYIVNESHVSKEESFSVQKKESLNGEAVKLEVRNPREEEAITFQMRVIGAFGPPPSEDLEVEYNKLSQEYKRDGITKSDGDELVLLKKQDNSPGFPKYCEQYTQSIPPNDLETVVKCEDDEYGEDIFWIKKINENDKSFTYQIELPPKSIETGSTERYFELRVIPLNGSEAETLQIAFDKLNTQEYSDEGITGGKGDNGSSLYVELKKPINSPMPADGSEEEISKNETEVAFASDKELASEEVLKIILENLKKIDDINIIAFPDMVSSSDKGIEEYIKLGYEYCFEEEYCFFIIDTPNIDKINDLVGANGFINKIFKSKQYIDNLTQDESQVNKYSAVYFPWLKIANPIYNPYGSDALFTEETILVPPSGAIAGIYARTDANRGVWKAPAGLEDGRINCAQDVEATFSLQDYGILNGYNINAIRPIKGAGVCVWGARTVAFVSETEKTTKNSEWRYINVRRLFNYVEDSLSHNLQWAVFEPNGPELWGIVKRNITAFLTDLWKVGAFIGTKPEEAFFIKVDENNNPPEIRDEGILIIEVGIAPIKPAEFIIIQISQMTLPG